MPIIGLLDEQRTDHPNRGLVVWNDTNRAFAPASVRQIADELSDAGDQATPVIAPFMHPHRGRIERSVLKAASRECIEKVGHPHKWDGFRCGAVIESGRVRLLSRQGTNRSPWFPELASLPADVAGTDALLDGEIIVGSGSVESFNALLKRARLRGRSTANALPVSFVAGRVRDSNAVVKHLRWILFLARLTVRIRFVADGIDAAHDARHFVAFPRTQILHLVADRLAQLQNLLDRIAEVVIDGRRADRRPFRHFGRFVSHADALFVATLLQLFGSANDT